MTPAQLASVLLVALCMHLPAGAADAGPCDPILNACSAAGFIEGAAKSGKGIIVDCLSPVLSGAQKIDGLPKFDAKTIAECNASRAASLAGEGPTPAAAKAPEAPLALPNGAPLPPNIVLVLVDDFSMNLMTGDQKILTRSMPNLARMIKDGANFSHYFVTDSLCCPSRTSIFTGLLPHNSQIYSNVPPDGGYKGFMAHGDDGKTFALTLHAAGYQTAMMGKYLNGYEPKVHGIPQGWSEWAVTGNGYPNFNYVLNHNGMLIRSPLHLTDKLSSLAQDFLRQAAAGPFFLEVATFSPHAPFVPPARYAKAFAGLAYPKTPAYEARPDAAAPDWLAAMAPITAKESDVMVKHFRNRVRSDKGVDDMIGALRQTLADLGVAYRTYVIFTSDNGFHMGEYSLHEGKMTPFDTDVHVPLVIIGPGIAAGKTINAVTLNIDFYPTFADWAGAPANPNVDGHSFAALLKGKSGPWRKIALVEHRQVDLTIQDDPDLPAPGSGNPPDYRALRLPGALYVEYLNQSNVIGYYDLTRDPYELHNIAAQLTPARKAALHAAMLANSSCSGQSQCWAAQSLTP